MTEDTQVRAIVLSVDETTNTIVCFSEPLESKINVKLPPNFIAKQGQRLTFGDHDYNNETYFPGSNPEWITIEDDPSVRFENNELLITTRAAFSFLDTHPTYSKKKVYAGGFGHVEIEDHLSEKMDRGIVYKVELSLNVLEIKDNQKPVFKVTKVYELLESEDGEAFLNELYEFDERTPAETDDEVVDNNQREIELPHVLMNENTESSARSESLTSYNRETLLTVAERSSSVEAPLERETTKNVLIDVNNDASNENVTSTSTEETGLSSSSSMFLLNCQSIDLSAQKSDGSGESSPEIVPFQEDRFEMVQDGIREDSSVQSDISSMDYPATEASSLGKDVRDSKPKPLRYGTLRFISEREENGKVYPKLGTVRFTEPVGSVIVNGATSIPARVMFSSNQKHGSYNKTVAFSDSYGLVRIPESNASLKHMAVYNTLIQLLVLFNLNIQSDKVRFRCQNEDKLKPIFISVGPLKQDENDPNARFIESMYNYEDNIFTETRSRGIASTRPPQNSWKSVGIQKEQKGNFKPRRVTLPNFYKALYVSDKQHGKLFGVLYTSVGDASLRVRPSIIDTGVMLNLSEWASVRLE
ncbi:hypothetical protein CRE_20151 [Caenorhabditis remanei]|uniref:RSD-2 N-terminal domain-containing protein n=1 Tax=Caenorhabditis remanei TaxID=31234 RepID=E3NTU0_CAERE|nr:hypothetical protein CRE_20151 [Caenorhabditis remanei]